MTMLMKVANEQWCNSNKKDLPCYACSLSFECAFCPFFCPEAKVLLLPPCSVFVCWLSSSESETTRPLFDPPVSAPGSPPPIGP